jgi:hypothetical protein
MKPKTLLSIIAITSLTLASCYQSIESRTYEAIDAAKSRFPNLVIPGGKEYKLVRSVTIPEPKVQIQLLEYKGPSNLILVISNGNNQFYAIPCPAIKFKNYWDFVYDTEPKPVYSKNQTFETELNKALEKLQLNVGRDGLFVLDEVFISVLNARVINKTDSANLTMSRGKLNFPDSCQMVDKQNYKTIAKSALKDSVENFQWGYVFMTDNKIININSPILKRNKKAYFKIEIYRKPCIIDIEPINL